jgi:predicted DNA-binding transcriptional regulator YafY
VRHAQLAREWRLLRELSAHPEGRSYTELARSLGAAVRTVYRDLETLRRAGFPVSRARVHTKQVWKMEESRVPGVAFTSAELTALAMARSMLAGAPGSPFAPAIRSAFHKIQAASNREGLRIMEAADKHLYADLRRARPYTEREVWFQMLLNAVARQRTVRIRYYTLERDTEGDREVDPYGLVFHEGAFYLVGQCHLRAQVRTFLLDRVRAVTDTGKVFVVPGNFSVREHFRQAWGLIRGAALEMVRVRFASRVARIIREGRWHESQKIEDGPGGSVILTVKVAGTDEIRRWLLGFGADVSVIEPESLRRSIAREGAAVVALYGKPVRRTGSKQAAV